MTDNRRGRGGRPASSNPRSVAVRVRVTPAEKAELEVIAGPGGVGEYLRSVALGRVPSLPRQVPQVNVEAWRALAPALTNVNTLARMAHEGKFSPGELVADAMTELATEIHLLRRALLGDSEDSSS